jgi:hypothetical protein
MLSLLMALCCGVIGWLYVDIPPRHQLQQLSGTAENARFYDKPSSWSGGASSQLIFDLNGYRLSLARWVDGVTGIHSAAEAVGRGEQISVLASPQRLPWWSDELVIWELEGANGLLVRYADSTSKYQRDGWFILSIAMLLCVVGGYFYYWHRRLLRQADSATGH